jgi:hypothetical protein
MKMIGWFSGGVTSAVAIKVAIDAGHDVTIYYMETGNHHPDHERFIADCEKWYGKKINIVKNSKYVDVHDVILKDKFINSPNGARCTKVLKKDVRIVLQQYIPHDFQIFGFEYERDQINRAIRFQEQYPDANAVFPLIVKKIDKIAAMKMIQDADIELPMMYKLGFSNSNCIGCVKGGMGYWNHVRKHFPDVFNKMAEVERTIGRTCLRRGKKPLYLDQLDPEDGRHETIALPECGVVCPVELDGLKILDDASLIQNSELFNSEWV